MCYYQVSKAILDFRAHQVERVLQGHLDLVDFLDLRVPLVSLAAQAQVDHQGLVVLLVFLVQQDQ